MRTTCYFNQKNWDFKSHFLNVKNALNYRQDWEIFTIEIN